MKTIIAAGLLLIASCSYAQEYHLPFKGRWFVMQGGDTPNVNQHMGLRAQWYGLDLMKVAGQGQRELSSTATPTIKEFYSWGEPVLSPIAGKVESIVDGLPDNALGTKDPKNPAGNHVVIAAANGMYVFLAHFQNGSVRVKPGQKVAAGQELGLCGNSGNSDAPHIHMHIQDTPTLNQGTGQNMTFKGINAELSGKIFTNVDWPLIRGLFIWD
jgi:hypothetical protein